MQQPLQFLCLGLSQVHTTEFFPQQLVISARKEAIGTIGTHYRVSAGNLTQAGAIQVLGSNTSGQASPFLVMIKDEWWLTVGSDHYDYSAHFHTAHLASEVFSKQLCAKVIADQAWRYSDVANHINQIALKSWIIETSAHNLSVHSRVAYQDGVLGSLEPISDVLSGLGAKLGSNSVLSCGSVAFIGGIRSAKQFVMQLSDPVLNRTIDFRYDIECLTNPI